MTSEVVATWGDIIATGFFALLVVLVLGLIVQCVVGLVRRTKK